MFRDEFKERYTTLPFAIYREHSEREAKTLISHRHREVELIAMTEGHADFYIDAKRYPIGAGDVLVIPPLAIHRAQVPSEVSVKYNCICFDLDLIWDKEIKSGLAQGALSVSNPIKDDSDCARELQDLIERGCISCETGGDGWELWAIGCVSMVFGSLKRNGYFISEPRHKVEDEFVRRAMEYISEHYASGITSTSAADALYMNNSYFCRKFKEAFGCCFSDYIIAYRLEKAKIFLTEANDPVTEISFRVGFNSCSYFSKAFKERFSVTPLALRRERSSKKVTRAKNLP